ncbi:Ras-related protein [Schistosoma japonicum]|uniref:Ras-related protein n=1 Tax=Schistosoma japonicum TaxID=6182 RepID=A0A4Z2DAZ3_SCHJA|nr:Ras-related protein [Schistosoma japonicum]
MDTSRKGSTCITEISKRISRARKASEITDSTILCKEKSRTTSLPLNDLLTGSFLQAFRTHHVSIYPDLNKIIEMAASDIQMKHETMDSMEKTFISSSEQFNKTLENLYNEIEMKLCQEEELMNQRLERKCEEMKNNANQLIEEKEEQTESLKEKLKEISILTDELQKETEDDKCTVEKTRTQCQNILDEIEEYEQLIDESKENVKELQAAKKVENKKKGKEDVTTCHKIQEECEVLMKKLNELKEINRCLRDLKDETTDSTDTLDYERIWSPEAFHVTENEDKEALTTSYFNKLPVKVESSKDEDDEGVYSLEEMNFKKNDEDNLNDHSKRSYELKDSKSLIFKVLLIGSFGVGKQALLNRLSHHSNQPFDIDRTETDITLSSCDIKIVIYQRRLDDVNYLIQFMKPPTLDFLNNHDFIGHRTCRTFYEKSDGIILIFDIWSKETFYELERYDKLLKENQTKPTLRKPIYMVLGNKTDLNQAQSDAGLCKVAEQRIVDFVSNLNGIFFEISAKSGENVQEAIDTFLRKLKLASEKVNYSKEVKRNEKIGCCSCCFL